MTPKDRILKALATDRERVNRLIAVMKGGRLEEAMKFPQEDRELLADLLNAWADLQIQKEGPR